MLGDTVVDRPTILLTSLAQTPQSDGLAATNTKEPRIIIQCVAIVMAVPSTSTLSVGRVVDKANLLGALSFPHPSSWASWYEQLTRSHFS